MNNQVLNKVMLEVLGFPVLSARRGGGLGSMVSWLIRVVIYDICVTSISEILGVSRLVALFIFLGILAGISFGGYLLKQRMSPAVDE